MKKPRKGRNMGWSRERWLWILLALIYIGLLVQGLIFGDWFETPDGRLVTETESPLLLPTNAPVRADPIVTPAPKNQRKKLDINQADAWMLTAIPGVGESMAQRIIGYRDAQGGLVAMEELKRVSGVGEKLYDTLYEYLEIQ